MKIQKNIKNILNKIVKFIHEKRMNFYAPIKSEIKRYIAEKN